MAEPLLWLDSNTMLRVKLIRQDIIIIYYKRRSYTISMSYLNIVISAITACGKSHVVMRLCTPHYHKIINYSIQFSFLHSIYTYARTYVHLRK